MKEEKEQTAKPADAGAAAPHKATPADPQLEELKELAARHGRTTMLAVVIFVVVVLPIFIVRHVRQEAKTKAMELLGNASQPADLENLAKDYPNTPAAPMALLSFARSLYDRQEYAKAQTAYEDFVAKYPKHAMASVAVLGKIHCLEGKGLLEDAVKGFDSFIADHKEHFLLSQATLGKARCLHQLGKTKEARIAIEDFLAAHPKSPWKPRAEEMLDEFKRPPAPATSEFGPVMPAGGTNAFLPSLMPALPEN